MSFSQFPPTDPVEFPPTDPVERDALAGEYVLGTLDAVTAARVVAAIRTDAALRDAVAAWETRLAPLAALAPPEAPPPGLWDRIDAALPGQTAAPFIARDPWWNRKKFWRAWAVAASAVAAGLAVFAVQPRAPETRFMTVLVSDRSQPAWMAQVNRNGALELAAIRPVGADTPATPSDRVMQLWALPPGATSPTSLGLLPREGGRVSIAAPAVKPVAGMLIEISLEPPGGSPIGRPTGPILFIGRLSEAGPRT